MLYETKEGQLILINLSMDVGILKQIFYGKSFATYKYAAIAAYKVMWQQKERDKCLRVPIFYLRELVGFNK